MKVLNMIVKDESAVIERCLNSMLEFIDALVICDTGSTDNTIEIIENWKDKNNKKGIILQHEWKNFEHNRNLALDACKEWIFECSDSQSENEEEQTTYICFIDADDYLVVENRDVFKQDLENNETRYTLPMKYDNTLYQRTFMVKADIESRWKGVLHEYLYCPNSSTKLIKGAYIHVNRDGARNSDPLKYLNDAVTLERGLESEPNNSRYLFYLAQSYRDFDYKQMAEQIYLERFEIPENSQERYISLVEAAKCRIYRDKNNDKTLNILMKAFCFNKNRLEAPYYIVRYFRQKELYAMGYYFGKSLIHNAQNIPEEGLFIDSDIYNWKFYDEVAVCSSWCNDKPLFKLLYEKILKRDDIPQKERERIQSNLEVYV